jgi:hypothetical protein
MDQRKLRKINEDSEVDIDRNRQNTIGTREDTAKRSRPSDDDDEDCFERNESPDEGMMHSRSAKSVGAQPKS